MIGLKKFLIVLQVLTAMTLNGCAGSTNKDVGSVVGAVVGTTLGVGIGILTAGNGDAGAGAALGAVIGLGVGGMLGAFIGDELDEKERLQADNASFRAREQELSMAEPITWRSETRPGVYGKATVVSTHTEPSVASPMNQVNTVPSKTCKDVREVYYIDNDEHDEIVRYCRTDTSPSWAKVMV